MTTRREFLRSAALVSAGFAMGGVSVPLQASSYNRVVGSNGKVNLAHIGIGNRGWEIINDFDKTGLANVVALCDVDLGAEHTRKALAKYPHAKRFKDFREMFDKVGNEIEAVAIATPDFAHFPAVMLSMAEGNMSMWRNPSRARSTSLNCCSRRQRNTPGL